MTVSFEYKVLDGEDPVFEQYTDIKMCEYYVAHGRIYLKLYKNTIEICIDMSDIKSFLIEN